MTTLCFYQGLRTIGGTVLEIATDNARCLFDFGFVYSPKSDMRVLPRPHSIVPDLLKIQILPHIEGLYSRKDLRGVPLAAFGESGPRPFVLISHMHIDHMGGLGMLSEDAEVYMTEESLLLYRGLVKADDVLFRPHRKIYGVAPMDWVQRGDLQFRLIPVDHDVPGACGFEIITPDGRLCYTGDLRLHGFHGELTRRFMELVKGADVCVTEGVSVSFIDDFDSVIPDGSLDGTVTEAALQAQIAQAAGAAEGIVYLNIYPRNILRLRALHDSLRAVGRRLALEPEAALLYRQFYPSESVLVYAPLADGLELHQADYVTKAEAQAHPERYVLQLSYPHLLEIFDFKPEGSLYIHSDGVPLGAYDPSLLALQEFLTLHGIVYRSLRCGGHAEPRHLKYILSEIAPKTLIPLHSIKPELIRIEGSRQLLPEAGRRYRLENGVLE